MKKYLMAVGISSLMTSTSLVAQTNVPNNYQPYTPTVVGGLPPNSRGLEQPVYVADRAMDIADQILDNGNARFQAVTTASPAIPTLEHMKQFEAGRLIAVVGEERITVGDLIPPSKVTDKLVANPQYEMLLRQALAEAVVRKALAQRFVNDKVSGKPVKERITAEAQIKKQTNKIFFEQIVPKQKEKLKCTSDAEFDSKLAEMGKSLQSLKTEFAEQTWAQEHVRENVKENPQVELSELQDYYDENIESYRRPAKVRFQILSAVFSKYPNKQAAYQAIVDMGNEVRLGGAPFDAVAKRSSTGFRASEGGRFDWTSKGALKSKIIDQTIFENPVTGLSKIIEDEDGFHIVEVLERVPESIQSFADAQAEIKKSIVEKKIETQRSDFIKKVRKETQVWTRWPADIPDSLDLNSIY